MPWFWLTVVGLLLVVGLESGYARVARRSPDQSEGARFWRGLRLIELRVPRYLLMAGLFAPGLATGGVLGIIAWFAFTVAMMCAVVWVSLLVRIRMKGQWPARPNG